MSFACKQSAFSLWMTKYAGKWFAWSWLRYVFISIGVMHYSHFTVLNFAFTVSAKISVDMSVNPILIHFSSLRTGNRFYPGEWRQAMEHFLSIDSIWKSEQKPICSVSVHCMFKTELPLPPNDRRFDNYGHCRQLTLCVLAVVLSCFIRYRCRSINSIKREIRVSYFSSISPQN